MSLYGIVNLSLICMRAEPSHRAELVNQMLFGEPYEVLEQRGLAQGEHLFLSL